MKKPMIKQCAIMVNAPLKIHALGKNESAYFADHKVYDVINHGRKYPEKYYNNLK
jgi:hypothetical protein